MLEREPRSTGRSSERNKTMKQSLTSLAGAGLLLLIWSVGAEAVTNPRTNVKTRLKNSMTASVSASFTCQLMGDGTARCWGQNTNGQLGNGNKTDQHTPVPGYGLGNVEAFPAGGGHACAVLSLGSVRCWGLNGSGQLGNGGTADSSTPVITGSFSNAKAIATGGA